MIDLLGELKDPGVGRACSWIWRHEAIRIRLVQSRRLTALGQFDDRSIASALLAAYPRRRRLAIRGGSCS